MHADLSNEQLYQIQKYACAVSSVKIIFASEDELRWDVIARFVDIGGIDDHHCITFFS